MSMVLLWPAMFNHFVSLQDLMLCTARETLRLLYFVRYLAKGLEAKVKRGPELTVTEPIPQPKTK